ncbi:hypothetical protein [Candidatus Lokiarchaeum ossiferum]
MVVGHDDQTAWNIRINFGKGNSGSIKPSINFQHSSRPKDLE